jgi:hypothetical protein
MGQQQLLLLVLGIVIVGLAVVVGIQAFSENQKKANADALVNDAIRIVSDAQAWKLKPSAFGGGASAANWTGLTFAQIGYKVGENTPSLHPGTAAEADQYENLNAVYDLAASGANLTITATSFDGGGVALNTVVVVATGTTPGSITTTIN